MHIKGEKKENKKKQLQIEFGKSYIRIIILTTPASALCDDRGPLGRRRRGRAPDLASARAPRPGVVDVVRILHRRAQPIHGEQWHGLCRSCVGTPIE